jgi:hypothetical protein
MMDRAHFAILMNFAKAPTQLRFREPAAALLARHDAAGWAGGPKDYELRELVLKAGWNTLQRGAPGVYVWAKALEGLLSAVTIEPEPEAPKLKEPDETWVKPRPDQGGK